MSDFPNTLHVSFTVEFSTDDDELAKAAILTWQDQLRDDWSGGRVGSMRIVDLVAIVADFSGAQRPMLAVIMEALVDRGWRVEGNTHRMIAPDVMGGRAYTLPDAVTAQTFREIGEA
jgi:hypothetical protein